MGRLLRIGVEGSAGHGRHLAERLVEAGFDVREVPPGRTAQRRRARRRAKTDVEDALAIARATAGEPGLGPVKPGAGLGAAHAELAAARAHRDMLIERRRVMLTRAEPVLAGLPLELTETGAGTKAVLPRLRAVVEAARVEQMEQMSDTTAALNATLGMLAELYADLRELDRRVRVLEHRMAKLINDCGSSLLAEHGIGVVGAATLLVEVGDPARCRGESAFNRWWGGAPVAISSGEGHGQPTRHRLDLLGNRAVNSVLYLASVTQARYYEPAQTYLARKIKEGHGVKEARRAHKTQLGRRVIRRMWADRRRQLQATTPAAPTAA